MKDLREIFKLRPTKPRTPTFRQGMQADQTTPSLRHGGDGNRGNRVRQGMKVDQTTLSLRNGGDGNRSNRVRGNRVRQGMQADQMVLSLSHGGDGNRGSQVRQGMQTDQTTLSLRHGGGGNRSNRALTPAVTTLSLQLSLPQEVISPTPIAWWRPPPEVKPSLWPGMGRKRLIRTRSSDDGESSRAAEKKQRNLQECYETGDPRRTAAENDGSGMEDVDALPDAKPLGDVIMTAGKGKTRIKYYNSFGYDGVVYELGDPVLVQPEIKNDRPYVGLIKFITQEVDGSVMVTAQWLYRPEEAKQGSGNTWEALDQRELFYSSHLDEFRAESVMHKCVVHFVPQNKKLPVRAQHPGFIVQRVYDFLEKRLWNLSDKDYKDSMQQEIDLLVQKTVECIGELPDIEPENSSANRAVQTTSMNDRMRKNMESGVVARSAAQMETPGICTNYVPKYHLILSHFKALTGDKHRNKWLEKLLEGIQPATVNGSNEKISEDGERAFWPNAAVEAITALEKATHVALGSDIHRYNQKMRQLVYNIKGTALARRLLNKELDPAVVVNMTPNELKAGSVTEKTADPEESRTMQMTNARCSRCSVKKVGVAKVIHSCRGDRYQLECQACGYEWYASPDFVLALVNDTPQKVVGDSAV